jgi:2-dehydro-3-deoxygluconokinase
VNRLVTLGEPMACLRADRIGPLRHAGRLGLSVAGAESNVAIGARRLGIPVTYLGCVGADQFGDLVRSCLCAEAVDARLRTDPQRPTGLMVAEHRMSDLRRVQYYRSGSAGSGLEPGDLSPDQFEQAGLLHLTGITAMLSDCAAEAVSRAAELAGQRQVPVSLDLNYRAALGSPQAWRARMLPLLAATQLLFASLEEAQLLLDRPGPGTPHDLITALRDAGPAEVVLTDGSRGAWAGTVDSTLRQPSYPVAAIDAIGAGDAFVAGYLAEHLSGADLATRLDTAARVAAICVATEGDWEGLPTRAELSMLGQGSGAVQR